MSEFDREKIEDILSGFEGIGYMSEEEQETEEVLRDCLKEIERLQELVRHLDAEADMKRHFEAMDAMRLKEMLK